MELLTATWRVTLGGIVLLDWSDYLPLHAEPKFIPAGKVYPIEPLRSAAASWMPRGLRTNTFTFSRIKVFDSDIDAREFLAAHVATLPVCSGPYALVIEQLNGGQISTGSAVLQSAGQPTTANNRFLADYTIVCGSLDYAAPGNPAQPVLGTSAGEVIDMGGGIAQAL